VTLDIATIIDIILLVGACVSAVFSIFPKRYPRAIFAFTITNLLIVLFCIHRLALIIGFILLWVYAGAIVAFSVAIMNIAGATEAAGRIKGGIIVLIIFLIITVLLVMSLPPETLAAPVEITFRDFAHALWGTHAFIAILLSLLVFTIIASALMIVVFTLRSK